MIHPMMIYKLNTPQLPQILLPKKIYFSNNKKTESSENFINYLLIFLKIMQKKK
jgi:hypothetical protein